MTKYRIATNGDRYRIEQRGFLGRWSDAASGYLPSPPPMDKSQLMEWMEEPCYFGWISMIGKRWDTRSLEDTQEALRLLSEYDTWWKDQKGKKWRSL